MEVKTGIKIGKEIPNFPVEDKIKIMNFISHVQENGLTNLPGRNKPSHDVPKDDPNWREKVEYAMRHNLWHYHIGIPSYETASNGERVSPYILHYILDDNSIKIVDFNQPPPFNLPSETYLR